MYSSVPATFPRRPWTPLALTIGLHLLLVLAWMGGASLRLPRQAPPKESVLVLLEPALRPEPTPEMPTTLPRPRPALPQPITVPAPPSEVAPAAEPQSSPQANPQPDQASAPLDAGAPAGLPGDLLATSKRMAGAVDRTLRNGSSPITAEPERKWERFAEAVAGARVVASSSVTLDSHTAADGVVIYRKTIGNRVRCYRSGSVGGMVTGFGSADGQSAGNLPCPTGVSWTRH